MLGATASGAFQDKFGRRFAFGLGGILSAIGAYLVIEHEPVEANFLTGTAMAYTSPDPADLTGRRVLFLFSKIVTGAGIGILMTTCQTYVSDIAPVKLRGVLLAFFPFFVTIGQLIAITLVFSRIMIFDATSFTVGFQDQVFVAWYADSQEDSFR